MKIENKRKAVNIRIFIIPFIIIAIIFFIAGNIMINNIKNHYYNHIKEDSANLAKSYSHSLTKATEAHKIANELLEEKLLVASRITAFYDGRHNNELLKELSDNLKVDEIYSYNPEGEIIYSNTGKYIGWKAYEGHPVYDFMISNSKSRVEDIRQDTESGIYYKYGYFKIGDGYFVQIGVLADKIQNFIAGFEMEQLLNEMKEDKFVAEIYFIDNNFNVLGSTNNGLEGRKITDQEVKTAINSNKEYGFINYIDGERVYEVFIPIFSKYKKIGTLAIVKSLKDTETIVKQISIIGMVLLSTIFVSLFYTMISTYNKNKKLVKLAYYDSLTGLPNRDYLNEFLIEEIQGNKDNKKAILLINFKNFKAVNLIFGFKYGDKILQELTKKLKKLTNSSKMLFRFIDNRLVLYVKDYNNKNDLIMLVNKISEIFNKPFELPYINKFIGVKVGIVEINNKYDNVDQLLKDASISLDYIKDKDSINYVFFNKEMEDKLQREEIIEREIRTALFEKNTKKIYLEYQPQVNLKTNRIIGFEALARMKTESLGYVPPIEFINIAERNQLMVPLGNWILKTACNFIHTLNHQGYSDIKVAVNISGIQLLQDDFTDIIMSIIKETEIKESNLVLEITESILLENFDIINDKLKQLRDLGIEIALDDFGTGYSSLSRIRELKIDCVKIDKYFISKIAIKDYKELITQEIISMSHKLGYRVVAEGVELEEQRKYLIENDCDVMQGYLFSRPVSQEDIFKILKNNYKE